MNLQGRRVHIVGSARPDVDEKQLAYVHQLIAELVSALALEGASFVVPFGKEPFRQDCADGPSIIFDWTVAEVLCQCLKEGRIKPCSPNGQLIATVATSKTDRQIPSNRREIYDYLRNNNAVSIEFLEPGWTSGAYRRQRCARLGDILIGVSGGEGVEHEALEYSTKGKAVIPLDIQIGASCADGSGGARRLFERALTEPSNFFSVGPNLSAADLLDRTRTRDCTVDVRNVVDSIMALLRALIPPRVFYVRLLNDAHSAYSSVENFFRSTVDPFIKELGYEPLQMGIGGNEFAWMNKAIFDSLHHSAVALVDITGLRPNCFMELGYALGNKQRVIVTARKDTDIPFDAFALEAFQWTDAEDESQRLERLRIHWARNINMPTLVRPTEAR